MSTDYAADIRKYTANVDDKAVASIVKFCGIALRGADSQWVSVTDPAEVKRLMEKIDQSFTNFPQVEQKLWGSVKQ